MERMPADPGLGLDLCAGMEETHTSRMVEMQQQGPWVRWVLATDLKISWSELQTAEPHWIKFMIQSVYYGFLV